MLSRFAQAVQTTHKNYIRLSMDLSLDRIRRLVTRFPPYTRPTIHITGTNGKGSVTALAGSILQQSGVKVGRFNSPHLVHVWDGILIGEKPISKERYYQTRRAVERANESVDGDKNEKSEDTRGIGATERHEEKDKIGATLFEVMAATALRIFEEETVDIAILEVGIGGRLDATNVLPEEGVVKVSAITSVDIDHARWLGSTVTEIAKEKAGIARKGIPFVIGPQKWKEAADMVEETAKESGARTFPSANVIWKPQDSIDLEGWAYKIPPLPKQVLYKPRHTADTIQPIDLQLPLHGQHQLENLSTALGIIECLRELPDWSNRITSEAITEGVRTARWPGRLTFFNARDNVDHSKSYTILVDGAHNESSLAALRGYLDGLLLEDTNTQAQDDPTPNPSPISYVLALSHSPPKTPEGILGALLRRGDRVEVVRFSPVDDMPWEKPVTIQEVAEVVKQFVGPDGVVSAPLSEGFTVSPETTDNGSVQNSLSILWNALQRASEQSESGLVVVTGSLYLVADFYRLVDKYPDIFRPL